MMRIDAELLPPFAMPSHPEWCLPIVTTPEWDALEVRQNVWRLDLAPNDVEPRTDAIAPTFQSGSIESPLAGWTPVITAAEQAAIQDAVRGYNEEIAAIDAKQNQSAEDRERRAALVMMRQELLANAFWTSVPNAFGDGGTAMYRRLSAPNVPFEAHCNSLLDVDRPITVRIYRWEPDKAQQNQRLDFDFGHWRIRFEKEDRAKLFRFKDGFTRAQRAAIEAHIQDIIDGGRLSAADKEQIAAWKDAIAAIKAAAKKQRRDLSPTEEQTIAAYQNSIDELKSSKAGLSQTEENQKKALEDAIYEDCVDLNLQETTSSLYNTPFALTIIPQQRGYITIIKDDGKNQFTYEDKLVTSTKNWSYIIYDSARSVTPHTPYDAVPRARMVVSGNGGAVMFAVGYPVVSRYFRLESRYHSLGFDWDGEGASFVGVWNRMPGTAVSFTAARDPANARRVKWKIEGTTDGRYMPFIYSIDLQIPAGPRQQDTTPIWSTMEPKEYHPVRDAQPVFDKDVCSRGFRVEFWDIDGDAAALWKAWNYQMRLYQDGAPVFSGHVVDVDVDEVHRDQFGYVALVRVLLADGWHVLDNHRIVAGFTGDNIELAPYVRSLLRSAGFADEEIVTDACPRIPLPRSAPGEEPKVRPENFASLGEWLRYLHEKYAYGCVFRFDALHRFIIEPMNASINAPPITSSQTDPPTRYVALRPVKHIPNWKDFKNVFVIIGAKDPETKKRYAAVFEDTTSFVDTPENRASGRFVGRKFIHKPSVDDNLNTQELVNAACRRAVELYGRPRMEHEFNTFYLADYHIGDRFLFDGKAVEVIGIDDASAAKDRMKMTVREV